MANLPIPVGTTQIYNSSTNILLPPAIYTFELYGAQGNGTTSSPGGRGGHSIGSIMLIEETRLYLHVGQEGKFTSSVTRADFGGGLGQSSSAIFGDRIRGGGGSSDIRLRQDNILNRVIVAGGGGATGAYGVGGNGGGTTGGDGTGTSSGKGGTQQAGGVGYKNAENGDTYGIGYGGSGYYISTITGSGGGGYHGGGGGYYDYSVIYQEDGASGGGGSGYLFTAATRNYPPINKPLNEADYLFDWEGTGLVTERQNVRTGAGIIYITCQALIPSAVPIWAKVDDSWREAENAYTKIDGTWRNIEMLQAKKDNIWN